MSNVLIGIIGVILFIGLALAGALILGDDFKTSSNSSRAAQVSQQLKQTADAFAMYQIKTGSTAMAGTSVSTLVPRFLKTAPVLPTGYGAPLVTDSEGRTTGTYQAHTISSALGTDSTAEEICKAIQEQTTGSQSYVTTANSGDVPKNPVTGCFKVGGIGSYSFAMNNYIAYSRI